MTHHVEREAPWLQAKVDQRLALMKTMLGTTGTVKMMGPTVVMSPLTEPPENATNAEFEKWDTSCDNCGRHDPIGFQCGHVQRQWEGLNVLITVGVCDNCVMEA